MLHHLESKFSETTIITESEGSLLLGLSLRDGMELVLIGGLKYRNNILL